MPHSIDPETLAPTVGLSCCIVLVKLSAVYCSQIDIHTCV